MPEITHIFDVTPPFQQYHEDQARRRLDNRRRYPTPKPSAPAALYITKPPEKLSRRRALRCPGPSRSPPDSGSDPFHVGPVRSTRRERAVNLIDFASSTIEDPNYRRDILNTLAGNRPVSSECATPYRPHPAAATLSLPTSRRHHSTPGIGPARRSFRPDRRLPLILVVRQLPSPSLPIRSPVSPRPTLAVYSRGKTTNYTAPRPKSHGCLGAS